MNLQSVKAGSSGGSRAQIYYSRLLASLEAGRRLGPESDRLSAADLELPEKLGFLLSPARYKVAYGGRGGAKSWGFARAALWRAHRSKTRVLCTREYQTSIQESVHRLLSDQIDMLGLADSFQVQRQSISGVNGSEFIFAGLRNNPHKIKSMEGVDVCWVEEAEKVSADSWKYLIPTIRKDGSEIWVTFNPDEDTDPTHKRFVLNPPPGAVVVKVNWQDNPWFPEELRKEKDYLASVDLDAYAHVWEGECRKHGAVQILRGKCVVEWFEPGFDWDGPYYGSDLGFAVDPTTLIKCWINGRKLMIERELYRLGLEIDETAAAFRTIEGAGRHVIRMDNARPETISYLKRKGLNVVACAKGKGSVEDGIAFLRSFEQIVIHPDCPHTAEESRLYSYKTDRLSGDVLPIIVDQHNHCWDGVRYALEPVMRYGPQALFAGCDLS